MEQNRRGSTRTYHSPLRAAQAERTRAKILEALVQVMADGPAAVSVPMVAAEAGVSVPTIYRHFGDKAGLMEAMVPFVGDRLGMSDQPVPKDLDELDRAVKLLFRRLDDADPIIRAALASGANPQARREVVDIRMAMLAEMLDGIASSIPDETVEKLSRVIVILTCSDALRLWHDRFDLDADAVADHVSWAITALIGGAST